MSWNGETSSWRTCPGAKGRTTHPLVLVSCGSGAGVSGLRPVFGQSSLRSRSSKRERAMCVQHTERNRRSRRRSTARVRHGLNRRPRSSRSCGSRIRVGCLATQSAPRTSPGPCTSSASASTGRCRRPPWTKRCRGCKTGESTWRTQHWRTAARREESTDSEAVS